jgi:hypothetical protein
MPTQAKSIISCPKCGEFFDPAVQDCPGCGTPARAITNRCWRCGHTGADVTLRAVWAGGRFCPAYQCVNGDECDTRWDDIKPRWRTVPGRLD